MHFLMRRQLICDSGADICLFLDFAEIACLYKSDLLIRQLVSRHDNQVVKTLGRIVCARKGTRQDYWQNKRFQYYFNRSRGKKETEKK